MKIKFKNLYDYIRGEVVPVSDNVVRINGAGEPNMSGFQIYTESGQMYGDYSDFTTLYKQETNGYMLSNDGTVYQEPEHEELPEPTLDEVKEQKMNEMSNRCEDTIYNGIDVVLSTGTEHFSLTIEDQLNLLNRKNQIRDGETQIEYHADGQPCKFYSVADMNEIINEANRFITYQTSYCNNLYQWIKSLDTIEDVQRITYGDIIPTVFQTEPVKML